MTAVWQDIEGEITGLKKFSYEDSDVVTFTVNGVPHKIEMDTWTNGGATLNVDFYDLAEVRLDDPLDHLVFERVTCRVYQSFHEDAVIYGYICEFKFSGPKGVLVVFSNDHNGYYTHGVTLSNEETGKELFVTVL